MPAPHSSLVWINRDLLGQKAEFIPQLELEDDTSYFDSKATVGQGVENPTQSPDTCSL